MRPRFFLILVLLAGVILAAAPVRTAIAADVSPFTPAAIPSLTPGQALVLQEAIRKGELTPEVREIVQAHPEVKAYLPPKWREEISAGSEEGGKEGAVSAKGTEAVAARAVFPPYDWRQSVYVSRLFLSRLQGEEGKVLTHFGHRLFDPRGEGAAPGDTYPVPDEYVVVPGDEIIVKLWGRMEGVQRMRVDREGKIFFPKLGSL